MWEVHYSQEAATYFEDNAALIARLYFAIESLAETDGTPPVGDYREIHDLIYWDVQEHLVVLHRIVSSRVVRVLILKPE